MKRLDSRHIAFHVLIALYFIWLILYAFLIAITLHNSFAAENPELDRIYMIWILLNLLMGTTLHIVIRLFRNKALVSKIVIYSYYLMAAASLATVLLVRFNA